jgi:hypothetical protein
VIDSVSLWDRAGVRGEARRNKVYRRLLLISLSLWERAGVRDEVSGSETKENLVFSFYTF